jgi:hypothetical protein
MGMKKNKSIDVPEIALFLSNCDFSKKSILLFLDEIYRKYQNNYLIINKVKNVLKLLKIKLPYHKVFNIQRIKKPINKGNDLIPIKNIKKEILETSKNKNINEILKFYKIKKYFFKKNFFNNVDLNKTINSLDENFKLLFLNKLIELVNYKINKTYFEKKRMEYENNKSLKNVMESLNEEEKKSEFDPFYQTSEKAFSEIKKVKNPGKFILIRSK